MRVNSEVDFERVRTLPRRGGRALGKKPSTLIKKGLAGEQSDKGRCFEEVAEEDLRKAYHPNTQRWSNLPIRKTKF